METRTAIGRWITASESLPNTPQFLEVGGIDHADLSSSAQAIVQFKQFAEAL